MARLLFLVASGLACADVDDRTDAGVRQDAHGNAADGGVTKPLGCSFTQEVALVAQPADLLILLDRSASMDTAFGSGTRFQAVASVLEEVVTAFAAHVRFGYQELPGRQGCAGQTGASCCASPPTVGIGEDSAAAVVQAINAAGPMDGNTPTAAALRAAASYYGALLDGIDHRYVLLATDGAPTCTLTGALGRGATPADTACADALTEVAALVSAGVRVIVLGVGPDLADDATGKAACLDALAQSGGAAASPGSPGYYQASDPEQLQIAIAQIFGGLSRPSCVLRFPTGVDETKPVALYLDGQQIPRTSGDGWRLDTSENPPTARITGIYCDAIQSYQVKIIEAQFGCPVCAAGLEC
jgi:hypothetical protein